MLRSPACRSPAEVDVRRFFLHVPVHRDPAIATDSFIIGPPVGAHSEKISVHGTDVADPGFLLGRRGVRGLLPAAFAP